MSIFVDENTKVVVQGVSPTSQGLYHGLRNKAYGTQVVAGTNPNRGGEEIEGIPVYATVAEAVEATGANASFISVPPKFAADAIVEAAAAGVPFVVCITEGIPAQDEALAYNRLVRDFPATRLLGPNCPGIISPGKCNIGITSGDIALAGGPVGIVSRSGTLTYQALHELSQQGVGRGVRRRGQPSFRTTSTMASPASVGLRATVTPAPERASILAWAVPLEPEMMAPAWPILRPGGAVTPAT